MPFIDNAVSATIAEALPSSSPPFVDSRMSDGDPAPETCPDEFAHGIAPLAVCDRSGYAAFSQNDCLALELAEAAGSEPRGTVGLQNQARRYLPAP